MILRIRLIIGIDKVEKLVYGRVFLNGFSRIFLLSLHYEINSIYIVLNQSTLHISKNRSMYWNWKLSRSSLTVNHRKVLGYIYNNEQS